MPAFKFSESLVQSMVGGTLVEYLEGAGDAREFSRATIVKAEFDPAGHGGEGELILYGDENCRFRGNMRIVTECKLSPEGVYSFYTSIMNVCYAFAPPGVDIPKR